MGVSPYVNRIYSDLTNGLIIFQLYDIIKPGTVDWKRVIQKFNKMRMMMEKIGKMTAISRHLLVKISRDCNGCEGYHRRQLLCIRPPHR